MSSRRVGQWAESRLSAPEPQGWGQTSDWPSGRQAARWAEDVLVGPGEDWSGQSLGSGEVQESRAGWQEKDMVTGSDRSHREQTFLTEIASGQDCYRSSWETHSYTGGWWADWWQVWRHQGGGVQVSQGWQIRDRQQKRGRGDGRDKQEEQRTRSTEVTAGAMIEKL